MKEHKTEKGEDQDSSIPTVSLVGYTEYTLGIPGYLAGYDLGIPGDIPEYDRSNQVWYSGTLLNIPLQLSVVWASVFSGWHN